MKIRIDKLDVLFSKYIRMRAITRAGGCERCLSPRIDIVKDNGDTYSAWKQLQCAHFHGRSRKSVRWDEDNCAGLCFGCHQYLDSHAMEKVEWFKNYLGEEAFDLLNARLTGKPDKAGLMLYYKEKLKGLS